MKTTNKVRGYIVRWDKEHQRGIDIKVPENWVWGTDDYGLWVEMETDKMFSFYEREEWAKNEK